MTGKQEKKILVLAYKFPPYQGVGARRWAKFAKCLAKEGYKVHIITADWGEETDKSWCADVKHENIVLNKWKSLFHNKYKKNLTGKIYFKAERILMNMFCWTDEAYSFYLWNKASIINYIRQEQIPLVVASGGPFSTNYFASKLKKKLPTVKVIQDYRDSWITDYFSDHPNMTPEDKIYKKEVEMEKYSVKYSDAIFSVTPGCESRLNANITSYNLKDVKHFVVGNGFDDEDRLKFTAEDFPKKYFDKECVNITHFGTLQFGREKMFYKFLVDNTQSFRKKNGQFCFHFFGSFNSEAKKVIEESEFAGIVKFHGFLPPLEVQKFMCFTDLHLVINDEIYYYAYGTKLYDALMYQKPVLLLSKVEGLYNLIKENGLGLVSDNSESENAELMSELMENVSGLKSGDFINKNYDFNKHSVKYITGEMIKIFNRLQ